MSSGVSARLIDYYLHIDTDAPRSLLVLAFDAASGDASYLSVNAAPGSTTCAAPLRRSRMQIEVVDAASGDLYAHLDTVDGTSQ